MVGAITGFAFVNAGTFHPGAMMIVEIIAELLRHISHRVWAGSAIFGRVRAWMVNHKSSLESPINLRPLGIITSEHLLEVFCMKSKVIIEQSCPIILNI